MELFKSGMYLKYKSTIIEIEFYRNLIFIIKII